MLDTSNASGTLTGKMLVYLREASPWLRFVGILGFVGAGVLIVTGIALPFWFGMLGGELYGGILGHSLDMGGAGLGAAMGGILGFFYIVSAVLTLVPSLFIYGFGSRIRRHVRTGSDTDLEQAFRNNKSLWKFTGILCIVCIALVIPGLVIFTIVSVVGAVTAASPLGGFWY